MPAPAEKPLFIPLRKEFYEAFVARTKGEEYRPYGPRWNERTCRIGRLAALSLGYGKAHRTTARVVGFRRDTKAQHLPGWVECYGPDDERDAAVIELETLPVRAAIRVFAAGAAKQNGVKIQFIRSGPADEPYLYEVVFSKDEYRVSARIYEYREITVPFDGLVGRRGWVLASLQADLALLRGLEAFQRKLVAAS